MLPHDPNGIDLPDWKRYGYASFEAWIGEKAGQSPRPCGCDFPASPECACQVSCAYCWPDFQEWPMPEIPADSEEESDDPADQ